MSDSRRPPRLSIEQRAARRDFVLSRGHDRFSALLRVLQGGREMELQPRPRLAFDLGPWPRRAAWLAVVLAIGALAASPVAAMLRDLRVDTWDGPDRTVQSGQRLSGCASVNVLHDDIYPTWVRYEGVVYQKLDLQRYLDAQPSGVRLAEPGYSLGPMRLLVDDAVVTGGEPDSVLIVLPPSRLAVVYVPAAGCV